MCVSSYYSSLAVHTAERDRRGNKETEISEWISERRGNISFTSGFLTLNTLVIINDTSVKWAPPPTSKKKKKKKTLAAHEHKVELKTYRWTFLRWLTHRWLWVLSHFLVFGLFTIWHKNTKSLVQKVNVCLTGQIYIKHPSEDRNANLTEMFPSTIWAPKGGISVGFEWGHTLQYYLLLLLEGDKPLV